MIVHAFKQAAKGAQERWRHIRGREDVQKALKAVQYGLLACIVVYLIYKISHVGWLEVVGALPESPWFYIFFTLRFLALPISELALYEIVWCGTFSCSSESASIISP